MCSKTKKNCNFARQMDKLNAYKIDINSLKDGIETRSMIADDDFFAYVQGNEIEHGNVGLEMQIRETQGVCKVTFQFEGQVQVLCDRCLEPMMQAVSGEAELNIKLGEGYKDDGDYIIVPENEAIADIAWQVYEQIALQIPIRHVHEEGECETSMTEVLDKHEAIENNESNEEVAAETQTTDPRWDALKKILSTNN